MNLDLAPEDVAFRSEVRAFLEEALTPELRAWSAKQAGVWADMPLALAWQKILHARGWVAPAWPVEYGGPGWSDVQRWIFDAECARLGTPSIPQMGIKMCGPVLMKYGTDAQKAYHLPRILSGEINWCQGYSEPQAGSDLAALQCRAERRGDTYVVNGSKIWTTYAHVCNWIFCLVRTDAGGRPQQGISFLLIPMDTPGISIRPLITLAGDHEVNQVFFDEVVVPAENLVGEENQGWTVAKYLLEFERGGAYASRLRAGVAGVRRIAAAEGLMGDDAFIAKLALMDAEIEAIDITERRLISALAKGRPVGGAPSMLKLVGTEAVQRIDELRIEAVGAWTCVDYASMRHAQHANGIAGPDHAVPAMGRYLNNRAATIYGGSSEVQRNIMARMELGL